jgi:DNA-binding response OmpR family regulator
MLTIQNLNKLNHKTLGKKNFYVESIREQFSIDNVNYTASEHQYKITITNRQYAITITLNRESSKLGSMNVYTLHSSTGHKLYLLKGEINNIDVFIDKLRLVALSKFK